MKVTISTNKFFERKPNANEIGKELSDAVFETIDIKPSDFSTIVEKGCVLSCNCNSVKYDYHYDKKTKYKGIQFVLIDVDECDLSIDEILNRMKYKPTVVHSSYSHLNENKQFKNCYHLYFFLDEEIEGIENYTKLFNIFSEGIDDILDSKVNCPQRIVFTNHKNNEHFEYHQNDTIYKVKDFIDVNQNKLRNLNDIINSPKNDSTHILYNRYNICDESKNVQVYNHYKIDNDFFNDLNSLKRGELVDKYFPIYPFLRESEYKIDNSKSYIDLRNQDYYEVFNKTRFDGDKGKFVKKKVENGNRHHQLFLDAIQFKAANPSISIEGLILALVNEVLNYYGNSDKEMTNKAIIQTALKVYNGDYKASKSKKKIKVNKSYFYENECSIQKKIGVAKRDLKDDAIGEVIDLNLSLEDNLDVIRKNGISLKKKRLVEFCERYNLKLKTNKEIRNDKIIELYNSNKDLSIAKLETICEMNGIDISSKTIERLIKNYLNESNQTKMNAQLKYCVYETKLASVV